MRTMFCVIFALLVVSCSSPGRDEASAGGSPDVRAGAGGSVMRIYYLEIVTRDVDKVCAVCAAANGWEFGDPDPALGHARTAPLSGGGLVGVRAPMRETEEPVIRPYWLVDDIESAVAAAADAGAEIALPPMLIPGHGTCAIYFEGGVEHGLWQR
jgi:predicted enzyme related to lactoylglutathione lyase